MLIRLDPVFLAIRIVRTCLVKVGLGLNGFLLLFDHVLLLKLLSYHLRFDVLHLFYIVLSMQVSFWDNNPRQMHSPISLMTPSAPARSLLLSPESLLVLLEPPVVALAEPGAPGLLPAPPYLLEQVQLREFGHQRLVPALLLHRLLLLQPGLELLLLELPLVPLVLLQLLYEETTFDAT
jgi:hypothetical protein